MRQENTMTDMTTRPATDAEMLAHAKLLGRVTYKHGAMEYADRRTATGVSHRTKTRATVHDDNGQPYVLRRGQKEYLSATHYTLPSGRTFIAQYRNF
jgi:hypothetical protein